MKILPALALAALAHPAVADGDRHLGAHEHGTGTLTIAADGPTIALDLSAPGADITGFEYPAATAEDRAAVDAALATLSRPEEIFAFPDAGGCRVDEARATLVSEGGEEDDHEEDHDGDHDAEDHDESGHAHHEAGSGHSEFRAEYSLTCADPDAVTGIAFGYFEAFANARELHVQVVSPRGAAAFEAVRTAPELDLGDLLRP